MFSKYLVPLRIQCAFELWISRKHIIYQEYPADPDLTDI